MNRHALIYIVLMFLFINPERVHAQKKTVATVVSNRFPGVTCTSSNAEVNADALLLASDTRDQLASLLKLGPDWRFAVHIHVVTPDDPLIEKIHGEGVSAVAMDKTMEIYAFLLSTDPDAREFIQRQFVTALLWEKFFANTQSFDTSTRLDVVPLWLIEGLREWLNDDPGRDRESIVKRATQNQRAPSLEQIAGWHDLSGDRLLGLWQRAFSYYLVKSLIRTEVRDNFQQWLATVAGPNPSSAKLLFPTEAGWQRELVEAAARSNDIVYTWDETASQLATAETLTLAGADEEKVRTCTLDEATGLPLDDKLKEALQQKTFLLTSLELRAHPSWRPVIALYRFGLSALVIDQNAERARSYLKQARERRDAEIDYHQKLVDYINWFEVTRDYDSVSTRFPSYFLTAGESERAQAKHPNPIRANLLHVESQL